MDKSRTFMNIPVHCPRNFGTEVWTVTKCAPRRCWKRTSGDAACRHGGRPGRPGRPWGKSSARSKVKLLATAASQLQHWQAKPGCSRALCVPQAPETTRWHWRSSREGQKNEKTRCVVLSVAQVTDQFYHWRLDHQSITLLRYNNNNHNNNNDDNNNNHNHNNNSSSNNNNNNQQPTTNNKGRSLLGVARFLTHDAFKTCISWFFFKNASSKRGLRSNFFTSPKQLMMMIMMIIMLMIMLIIMMMMVMMMLIMMTRMLIMMMIMMMSTMMMIMLMMMLMMMIMLITMMMLKMMMMWIAKKKCV